MRGSDRGLRVGRARRRLGRNPGALSVAAVGARASEGFRTRRCATRWLQVVGVGGSGGVETAHLLVAVFERVLPEALSVEDQGHRFGGEVAAGDEPFVVLFDQQRAGEADHGGVVGEDPDDVGAAADLAVDALERVGGAQLGPVLGGKL